MARYKSNDNRTGYQEGEIVELTNDELNKLPFNVCMQMMEPVDDKKKIEDSEDQKKIVDMKEALRNRGLSPKRIDKIVEKYPSLTELKKKASKAGIDPLTDEFIKKQYGRKVK